MQKMQADISELHQFAATVRSTVNGYLSALIPDDLNRTRHTTAGEMNLGRMLGYEYSTKSKSVLTPAIESWPV